MSTQRPWTRYEMLVAFSLYRRLPVSKFQANNPEIIQMSEAIGRTPSSLKMRLSNIASIDPEVTGAGHKGLRHGSKLLREVWEESLADPERFAVESEQARVAALGKFELADMIDEPDTTPSEYTLQSILDDGCFLPLPKLQTTLNRLKSKKNLILQGPPGTGKTWLARRLAYALIGKRDDSRVRRFQFHPNLSYEDFIRGYRPNPDGKLDLVDGPFFKAITDAGNDPCNDYVIVIEEINRGNPEQILGEMLTLLEADKRSPGEALALAHSREDDERVHIPDNLYVIGTMNLADRSIALVDLALRRRFAFIDLAPTFGEVWRNWVNGQCGIPLDFLTNIENRVTALNDKIASDGALGPQFQIGHSYLTPTGKIDNPTEWFTDVVETEIAPLLDEYWFDNAQEAETAKSDLLDGMQ